MKRVENNFLNNLGTISGIWRKRWRMTFLISIDIWFLWFIIDIHISFLSESSSFSYCSSSNLAYFSNLYLSASISNIFCRFYSWIFLALMAKRLIKKFKVIFSFFSSKLFIFAWCDKWDKWYILWKWSWWSYFSL